MAQFKGEDEVGQQSLCYIKGLNEEEKLSFLQLVKQVLHIQKLGRKNVAVLEKV